MLPWVDATVPASQDRHRALTSPYPPRPDRRAGLTTSTPAAVPVASGSLAARLKSEAIILPASEATCGPPQVDIVRQPHTGTADLQSRGSTGRRTAARGAWIPNLSPLPADCPMTPAREPAIAYLQSRGSEGLRSPPISALSPPTVVTVSRAGDLIFNTRIRRPPVARVDGPPRSSSPRISDLSQLASVGRKPCLYQFVQASIWRENTVPFLILFWARCPTHLLNRIDYIIEVSRVQMLHRSI